MGKLVGVLILVLAGSASAQSVNINFGSPPGTPSATYAAAGLAGAWNSITGAAGPTFKLVGLDGSPTGVQLSQGPTVTMLTMTDSSVTGDDGQLLNSGLNTLDAETCLFFSGFQAGTYEVLVYAWSPDQPSVMSRTRQDQAASTVDVGGAWTGRHVEGVTYAKYTATVGADGALPAHSGRAPGQLSAALNGIQIRNLADPVPGDDAGTTGGGGATGDAGTTIDHHGGGCSTGSGGVGSGMALLALAFVRRRSRNRRS